MNPTTAKEVDPRVLPGDELDLLTYTAHYHPQKLKAEDIKRVLAYVDLLLEVLRDTPLTEHERTQLGRTTQ